MRHPGPAARFVVSPEIQRKLDTRASLQCAAGAVATIGCSATAATAYKWLVLVWPVGLVAALAIVGVAANWGFQRWLAGRSVLRPLLVATVCLALTLTTLFTAWPLRTAFMCSRASFDDVAARVRAGEQVDVPLWIGPFRIVRAEPDRHGNGVVCLWTDLHPNGYTGFVRCGPVKPPFNLWSHRVLDERWQFISED